MKVFEKNNKLSDVERSLIGERMGWTMISGLIPVHIPKIVVFPRRIFQAKVAQFRQFYSQFGKSFHVSPVPNSLEIIKIMSKFCNGMLCAFTPIPVIKRKTEMKNIESKVNYNLLHTYLYVSYLDKIDELNNISSTQKDIFLSQLCSKPGYNDMLCLNLILSGENILSQTV